MAGNFSRPLCSLPLGFWARRCATCGSGDAPCCFGTTMCDMQERRCSLLLDLGHGDVRYVGAAMLSAAGLRHGDVRYARAAMLLAQPWALPDVLRRSQVGDLEICL